MKTQFVPQEIALELKELGFDKPCCAYYDGAGYVMIKEMGHCVISAPTFAQAFRFFREKYELLNHLTTHLNPYGEDGALEESYGYRIMFNKDGWKCNVWEELSFFDTYEEAELACLVKLIEIVKNK